MRLRLSSALAICAFVVCLSARSLAATAQCTLSHTNQTVTICTPSNGATVQTTFHVNAGATDSSKVSTIQLYVNTKLILTQSGSVLDANVTLPAGNNTRFVVQAKDAAGVIFKTIYTINVVAGATLTISPQNPTVTEGEALQFTASTNATWSATCGSIDSSGNFTAPFNQPSCQVKATATRWQRADGFDQRRHFDADHDQPVVGQHDRRRHASILRQHGRELGLVLRFD